MQNDQGINATADFDQYGDPNQRTQVIKEYIDSVAPKDQGVKFAYSRISLMTFIILSIVSLILSIITSASIIISLIFVVLFAVSYMKMGNAGANAYSYLFIFAAPPTIGILASFIPFGGLSILTGFGGIIISYWILDGKNMLD